MTPYKLTIDQQAKLTAAEVDEAAWRREMLAQSIRQTTLLEQGCDDHKEFRGTLRNALILLGAIAAAVGSSVGLVL